MSADQKKNHLLVTWKKTGKLFGLMFIQIRVSPRETAAKLRFGFTLKQEWQTTTSSSLAVAITG
jgi:hypothetical protein